MDPVTLVLLMLVPEILFILFMIWYLRLNLIFKGVEVKLAVTPAALIGMRLRRVNGATVCSTRVKLLKAGVNLQLENQEDLLPTLWPHYLAGSSARIYGSTARSNRAASLSLKHVRHRSENGQRRREK